MTPDNNKDDKHSIIRELQENSKVLVEIAVSMAHVNRTYFEELVRVGFDEKQALELTKAHGVNMYGRK